MTVRTMRLFSNPLSPFARKVRVAAHELGLANAIEIVDLAMSPVAPNAELCRYNPLGKLPTLVLRTGEALFDSSVIITHLDGLAGAKLIPRDQQGRLAALRLEALGDGIAEAAVAARYENALRPTALQWTGWSAAQLFKVTRALEHLDRATALATDPISIGEISVGCALGYLDTRFPELEWRKRHSNLATWETAFSSRPSMQATMLTTLPSPQDTATER